MAVAAVAVERRQFDNGARNSRSTSWTRQVTRCEDTNHDTPLCFLASEGDPRRFLAANPPGAFPILWSDGG
jgi:hypothetical protein